MLSEFFLYLQIGKFYIPRCVTQDESYRRARAVKLHGEPFHLCFNDSYFKKEYYLELLIDEERDENFQRLFQ